MQRSNPAPDLVSKSPEIAQRYSDSVCRVRWGGLRLMAISLVLAAAVLGAPPERPRETVLKLVAQIQKADYEGNRVALQNLYTDLEPFNADEKLASPRTLLARLRPLAPRH